MKLTSCLTSGPPLHDFREALRGNGWILFLESLALFILIPASTAASPQTSIFNIELTHEQLKFRFFDLSLAPALQWVMLLSGAAVGMNLCRFFLNRRQGEMLLAVGIRRETLFLTRLAAGALTHCAALLPPLTLSLLLNRAALGPCAGMSRCFFGTAACLLLPALLATGVFMAACAAAGTWREALLLGTCSLALPALLIFGADALAAAFLFGNPRGVWTYSLYEAAPSFFEELRAWNPLGFFDGELRHYGAFIRELTVAEAPPLRWKPILAWSLATAAVCGAALLLTLRRKAEHIEAAASAMPANFILVTLPPLGLSLALLRVCEPLSAAQALLICAIGAICCRLTLLRIFLGVPIRRGRALCLPLDLALLVICAALLQGGGLGYAARLPDPGALVSAEISYVGSPCYLSGSPRGSSDGRSFYVSGSHVFTDAPGKEAALSIHRRIIGEGRRPFGVNREDYKESVLPYDILISYKLSDGREMARYYDRASAGLLSEMLDMDALPSIRARARQVVLGEEDGYSPVSSAYGSGQIYIADPFYQNIQQIIPRDRERRELLAALAADVAAQDVADRYFPQEMPLCALLFSSSGENAAERFTYSLSSVPVYLTEAFAETLALLRRWGALPEARVPRVEKILLQPYDPYGGMNGLSKPVSPYFMAYRSAVSVDFMLPRDFGKPPEVTDPEVIADLLGGLRSCYFVNDGGFLAAVKPAGKEEYIYLYLPYEETPPYIRERFG